VVLAAVFVFVSGDYTTVFFFATIPYVLSIVNMLGYPAELDGEHDKTRSPAEVIRHLRASLSVTLRLRHRRPLTPGGLLQPLEIDLFQGHADLYRTHATPGSNCYHG
jgi:hypothetical protein